MSVSPLIIHPYVSYPDITHAQLDKHLQESFLRPNLHLKAEKQHDPSCQGGGRSEHSPLNICIRFAPATSGWGWRRWRRAFELQSAQKSALQGETRRAGPERDSDRRRRTLQPLVNQKKTHKAYWNIPAVKQETTEETNCCKKAPHEKQGYLPSPARLWFCLLTWWGFRSELTKSLI